MSMQGILFTYLWILQSYLGIIQFFSTFESYPVLIGLTIRFCEAVAKVTLKQMSLRRIVTGRGKRQETAAIHNHDNHHGA